MINIAHLILFILPFVGVLLFKCDSFPLESHEGPEDADDTTEIEAEYICSSDRSISELKSLARSNNSCDGKDYDFEYWLASCHCTINPLLTCPPCPENSYYDMYQQRQMIPSLPVPEPLKALITSTVRPLSTSLRPQSSTTPAPVIRTSLRPPPPESDTHAKIIRNTTSNSLNFIRFG